MRKERTLDGGHGHLHLTVLLALLRDDGKLFLPNKIKCKSTLPLFYSDTMGNTEKSM